MRYSITHKTCFEFDQAPGAVIQRLHLTPQDSPGQQVIEWHIEIEGGTLELATTDFHGNSVHLCRHDPLADAITITCGGHVQVDDLGGIVGPHDSAVPLAQFLQPTPLSTPGPRLRLLVRELESLQKSGDLSEPALMHHLSARVLDSIAYTRDVTDVTTTAEKAMELGAGVCQDHVHAFIAIARRLGFAARYVSGYLMMDYTQIQSASHAWAEVHLDGLGWVGFDISNAISPDERYIKLATGFDYVDVIPVSGVRFGAGGEQISTRIMVEQQ